MEGLKPKQRTDSEPERKPEVGLLNHMKIHVVSPECGARMQKKCVVSLHRCRLPFACAVCEEQFSDRAALREHLATHSKVCPDCGLIIRRDNLTIHLRNAHHVCPICEQRFSDRAALKEHLMTHRDDGTLQASSEHIQVCADCGDMFFSKSALQRHLRGGCSNNSSDSSPEELPPVCLKTEEEAELLLTHKLPLHTVKTEDTELLLTHKLPLHTVKTEDPEFHHGYEMNVEESGLFNCSNGTEVWAPEQTKQQNGFNDTIQHHLSVTEPFSCSEPTPFNYLQERHTDTSDTDDSIDYSQEQTRIKGTYAMVLPDCPDAEPIICPEPKPSGCSEPKPLGCSEPKPFICPESKPFSCLQCGEIIERSADVTQHMRTHGILKPFRCSVCGETFSLSKQLKTHERSHMVCSVCGKRCHNREQLSIHMRTHKEKPFSCKGCGRLFVEQSDLTKHLKLSHNVCPVCYIGFKKRELLKGHMERHSDTQLLEVSKPFNCSVCDKRFINSTFLQCHMKVHSEESARSEEKPLRCSVCEKIYKVESSFVQHMKTHTHTHTDCPDCGRSVTLSHVSRHRYKFHMICPSCGERFSDRAALSEHMVTHSNVCPECGVNAKEKLLVHRRNVHHVCPVCEKKLTKKVALKNHLRIHFKEGTKPPASASVFFCSRCREVFFSKEMFTLHDGVDCTKKKNAKKNKFLLKKLSSKGRCLRSALKPVIDSDDSDSTEDWLPGKE